MKEAQTESTVSQALLAMWVQKAKWERWEHLEHLENRARWVPPVYKGMPVFKEKKVTRARWGHQDSKVPQDHRVRLDQREHQVCEGLRALRATLECLV